MTPVIGLFTAEAEKIAIPDREIWRYLGYRGNAPDGAVLEQIEAVRREFLGAVQYKACFAKTKTRRNDAGEIFFPFGTVRSKALERSLAGCEEAYVFCATAGIGADRLISRYAVAEPARSVIADAVATAAVEAFCDSLCASFGGSGYLRPRFSPGYGDLSLEYQSEVLRYLDAARKINVQLTQSMMMVPSKSVTAIAGIGREQCAVPSGCRTCTQKDCAYRRR